MPLIAILGNVRRITCIGDQKQLVPFSNLDTRKMNVGPTSFFHRLNAVLRIPMLQTQYRMSRDICNVVSTLFYDKRLVTDAGTARERKKANKKNGPVISWIHHCTPEAMPKDGYSIYNEQEITGVCSMLMHIAETNGSKEVLVITFYKEQRDRIENEYRTRYLNKYSVTPNVNNDNQLRIMTVDACQGTEADWVILSMVRSGKHGIGFLKSESRANVAISRAREKLIVMGNKNTFYPNKTWRTVIQAAKFLDPTKNPFSPASG